MPGGTLPEIRSCAGARQTTIYVRCAHWMETVESSRMSRLDSSAEREGVRIMLELKRVPRRRFQHVHPLRRGVLHLIITLAATSTICVESGRIYAELPTRVGAVGKFVEGTRCVLGNARGVWILSETASLGYPRLL